MHIYGNPAYMRGSESTWRRGSETERGIEVYKQSELGMRQCTLMASKSLQDDKIIRYLVNKT